MKRLQKILVTILSASIIMTFLFSITAYADGFSIFSSSKTARTGETVTIDVKITGGSVGTYSVFVNFDPSMLEYKSSVLGEAGSAMKHASCSQSVDNPSQIIYVGSVDNNNNTYVSGTVMSITFLVVGSATGMPKGTPIGVQAAAYDSDGKTALNISTQGSSVLILPSGGASATTKPQNNTTAAPQVTANPSNGLKSSDATLKSLRVYGVTDAGAVTVDCTLSPAFASGTLFYNTSVMGDVSKLQIEAIPNSETAKVSIPSAYLRVDIGKNTAKITVTAEDGTENTYVLTTEKSNSGTSILAPVESNEYTEGLSDETTTEAVGETETVSSEDFYNNSSAAVSNNVTVTNKKNKAFIIIGIVSGVCALTALGFSVALFVNNGKKKKKNTTV